MALGIFMSVNVMASLYEFLVCAYGSVLGYL